MKRLVFIIPVQLCDDGALEVKNLRSLKLMLGYLESSYEITLLVQTHRNKRISKLDELGFITVYDNSLQKNVSVASPSRFYISYARWAEREHRIDSVYDCLIAWDGCSPWCLATALTCVSAKRRILWLHDNPDLYMMQEDQPFYSDICKRFDSVIASDDICEEINCEKVRLPIDSSWYWGQSAEQCNCEFSDDEINLLAVSKMSIESDLEKLPSWLFQHQEQNVHCYLIGAGKRLDRYIYQVAICSVDEKFTLLGDVSPYPYIYNCDALIVCKNERSVDIENAANMIGVPVITVEELEQRIPEIKKRKQTENIPSPDWKDKDKLIAALEE